MPPQASATTTLRHLAVRRLRSRRTLNDMVEEVHLTLVEDEDYLKFLEATWDEQAVEGSCTADQLEAAAIIRDKARSMGLRELAEQKKVTIGKALGVVLRRYGFSRKERRHTVGGELVPSELHVVSNGE